MALYDRFLEYESDPETLIRTGVYLFIAWNFFTFLNQAVLGLSNVLDLSSLFVILDNNGDIVASVVLLNFWTFFTLFYFSLLSGIGALAFLKIAFNEELLIWLRLIALVSVIVLVFGSGFLF